MHPDYLGDAKDFVKRQVFDLLRGVGTFRHAETDRGEEDRLDLLGRLFVYPMLTDSACLTDQRFLASYRGILGGEPVFVSQHGLWGGDEKQRDRFLSAVNSVPEFDTTPHTLFLDPDTGVLEDDDSDAGRQRVKKRDLICLFENEQDRIVIVFDDSYSFGAAARLGHGDEARRLQVLQTAMSEKLAGVIALTEGTAVAGFGYIGMSVNLLFFATPRATRRLESAQRRLVSFLGGAAERRIVSPRRSPSV